MRQGDWQWKIYRLKKGDWLQVFLVPVPLFQRLVFPFLPVAQQGSLANLFVGAGFGKEPTAAQEHAVVARDAPFQ